MPAPDLAAPPACSDGFAACYDRFDLQRPPRLPRLLFVALLLALPACGVSFGESWDGTETFKTIRLDGERRAGAELTLTLGFTQTYPVPVRIACYYEDGDQLTDDQARLAFQERTDPVYETVLPPSNGRPDDEVEEQELSFRFSVPKPGDYFVACLTPAAPENGLGMSFTIKGN